MQNSTFNLRLVPICKLKIQISSFAIWKFFRSEGQYRGDVFDLYPGFIGTVEMRMIAVGNWLLHCHVFDHLSGGMQTTYSVLNSTSSTDNGKNYLLLLIKWEISNFAHECQIIFSLWWGSTVAYIQESAKPFGEVNRVLLIFIVGYLSYWTNVTCI